MTGLLIRGQRVPVDGVNIITNAEDARIITVKKIEGEILANERAAGAEREARSEDARAAAHLLSGYLAWSSDGPA